VAKLPRLSSSSFLDVTKAKFVCLGTIGLTVVVMGIRALRRGAL
jgi:hypothetical protein